MSRTASLTRTTSETDISLTLSIDGSGRAEIATGIGFLDHMLTAHGRRPFTGDRRVLVAMGSSYLDALGRAAARPEADRRA